MAKQERTWLCNRILRHLRRAPGMAFSAHEINDTLEEDGQGKRTPNGINAVRKNLKILVAQGLVEKQGRKPGMFKAVKT